MSHQSQRNDLDFRQTVGEALCAGGHQCECGGATRPSLAWTTTNPVPEKASWNASPEPRPISAPAPAVRRTLVASDEDHATAACMSAYVGASTVSTTGVPWAVIATCQVPGKTVWKTPPASIEAPSTFLMSQVSAESKASTLRPFTVTESPSRVIRGISLAESARSRSA